MRLFSWLLDLIYPPKCTFCGKLLKLSETDICASCRLELPRCEYGFKRGAHYKECFSVCYYEKNVRRSIRRFKFSGQRQFASVYGKLMAMLILEKQIEFDLLTWVPLSKQRKKKRGYCQTKLIAETIGAELGTEPIELLKKIKDKPAQSSLKKFSERQGNVTGAYQVILEEQLQNKTILLVDDVITSGATLSECSRMLKNAGAKSILCVTFAVTRE